MDGAQDGVLLSGTPGTHLTLACCWARPTSCKHAEVGFQRCFRAAHGQQRKDGSPSSVQCYQLYYTRINICSSKACGDLSLRIIGHNGKCPLWVLNSTGLSYQLKYTLSVHARSIGIIVS